MSTAELVVALMGAGGGGAALLALVTGVIKWLSGSAQRQRDRSTDLIAQRRDAIKERDAAIRARDTADRRRRKAYEALALCRRMMIEAGMTPPPWPMDASGPITTPTKIKEKRHGRKGHEDATTE